MRDEDVIRRARFILDRVARNLQGQAIGHAQGRVSAEALRQTCLTASAEVRMVKLDLEES